MKKLLLGSVAILGLAMTMSVGRSAKAAEDASCATVRFANPGWTDILITTSFATNILQALGYQTKDITLSTSVSWKSVAEGDVDVFLGNWTPSQDEKAKPYLGKVKIVGTNLVGTRYTMATTKKAYDEGLKTVADLAKFKDKLGGKVYGINPGSSGNTNMMNAIADAKVTGFTLVESSEEGMLSQVQRNKDGYVVFLGWTPHWMNSKYQMAYVGGKELDKYFGKGGGYGVVRTVVNKQFAAKCPNVTKLAGNLRFTMDMENSLMSLVGEKKQKPEKVTVDYLKANPAVLEAWLKGVTAKDGSDGLAAVKKAFGMM